MMLQYEVLVGIFFQTRNFEARKEYEERYEVIESRIVVVSFSIIRNHTKFNKNRR